MIRHRCWRCQKVETADVEWQFCPHCGAPYQDSHKENTQNMPIVDDYVAGYQAWRDGNGGQQIQTDVAR